MFHMLSALLWLPDVIGLDALSVHRWPWVGVWYPIRLRYAVNSRNMWLNGGQRPRIWGDKMWLNGGLWPPFNHILREFTAYLKRIGYQTPTHGQRWTDRASNPMTSGSHTKADNMWNMIPQIRGLWPPFNHILREFTAYLKHIGYQIPTHGQTPTHCQFFAALE